MDIFDVAIIGAGINGAGIARDAAGRNLKVALIEQNDIASATSSYSSKLIHGGLRYLEHYQFALVRQSLQERKNLLRIAPHLVHPLQFIMPYCQSMRPAWLIKLGLFVYDHLSHNSSLPKSKKISFAKVRLQNPLKKNFKFGFGYYDCQTDDARLVIANAKSAQELGAKIYLRTQCVKIQAGNVCWNVECLKQNTQEKITIHAKTIVNASGPWLNHMMEQSAVTFPHTKIKKVKGSHIIVKKLYEGEHAYILQNVDKRIIFVIPFENDFHIIGTTDVAYSGDPAQANITEAEIDYLLEAINTYFQTTVSKKDIIHTYSGIRALQESKSESLSKMSRDYKIECFSHHNLPFINIVGGKLTTYRKLAEQTVNTIIAYHDFHSPEWTANKPLYGADFINSSFSDFQNEIYSKYSGIPKYILSRLTKQYGSKCEIVLKDCRTLTDLGKDFGVGLYQKEVEYLIENEWAETTTDILWRRTKLGLYFSKEQIQMLKAFLDSKIFYNQSFYFSKKKFF